MYMRTGGAARRKLHSAQLFDWISRGDLKAEVVSEAVQSAIAHMEEHTYTR
jgi:hypothetical protein